MQLLGQKIGINSSFILISFDNQWSSPNFRSSRLLNTDVLSTVCLEWVEFCINYLPYNAVLLYRFLDLNSSQFLGLTLPNF